MKDHEFYNDWNVPFKRCVVLEEALVYSVIVLLARIKYDEVEQKDRKFAEVTLRDFISQTCESPQDLEELGERVQEQAKDFLLKSLTPKPEPR